MSFRLASVLIIGLAVAGGVRAAQEHTHAHQHAAHSAAVPATAPAGGWATDAPLREGMARVHAAIHKLHHHDGALPAELARAEAREIQSAVSFMFANCKLDADADAALHQILLPLQSGAAELERNPADPAPIAAMHEAMEAYPRQFDDPSWGAQGSTPAQHQH